jgi:uncharacterized membrane protein
MKYKVKRKRVSYTKESALLLLMLAMIIGIFGIMGFYAGKKYAIEHTTFRYEYGNVILELDGNMYDIMERK